MRPSFECPLLAEGVEELGAIENHAIFDQVNLVCGHNDQFDPVFWIIVSISWDLWSSSTASANSGHQSGRLGTTALPAKADVTGYGPLGPVLTQGGL